MTGEPAGAPLDERLLEFLGIYESAALNEVQRALSACMEEHGFEYVPWVPGEAPSDVTLGPYGVYAESSSATEGRDTLDVGDDPNRSIYDALTPDAQQRYDEALFGAEHARTAITDSTGRELSSVPGEGCADRAYIEVTGASLEEYAERNALWGERIDELHERAATDTRAVAAWSAWAECMGRAGYSVENRAELVLYLSNLDLSQEAGVRREVEVHAVDQGCDETTQLSSTLASVATAWERDFLEKHPALGADLGTDAD